MLRLSQLVRKCQVRFSFLSKSRWGTSLRTAYNFQKVWSYIFFLCCCFHRLTVEFGIWVDTAGHSGYDRAWSKCATGAQLMDVPPLQGTVRDTEPFPKRPLPFWAPVFRKLAFKQCFQSKANRGFFCVFFQLWSFPGYRFWNIVNLVSLTLSWCLY